MNEDQYWFVSQREWQAILEEINSPNPFRYQTFSISLRKAQQLKPIGYFDTKDYSSIINYCLANPDSCHGLTEIFDLLANQYGAGHYLKSLPQQSKVLIDGLQNQHIVLLRETVIYDDYQPIQPTLVKEKVQYLSTEEFIVSHMDNPTNWIQFDIVGAPNEPFTLFNNKTGQIITHGQLDASGQAYVDIPEQTVFLVDVAFSKTKEYRSWYYAPLEYHSQLFAGSADAFASSLDAMNDVHLAEVVPIAKLYHVLGLSKYFSPNSPGGSKVMPAKTQSGELIRSVSAFITGFYLLDLVGFSYIKPLSTLGQYGRGVAAFGLVNATVTPVMEKRVADLLSKDVGLKSVVLDYLSVHPDDSNAEARFKNGLEGLALGAVLEPLFIVFRIIKNTLTRTLITRIPTRRTYKLEAEKVEIDPIKPAESTEQAELASDISKTDDILAKAESDVGKYLEDFNQSPTPTELVQLQTSQGGSLVEINTEHILNGEIKTYANGTKIGTGGHYLKDPNIKVNIWSGAADANGITKGYISVRDPVTGQWYKKQTETTFFPAHWSKRQTELEIKSAFENSKTNPDNKEMWMGTSSSGLKIEGYYSKPNGTGATAWPIYQGIKN